MQEDDTKGRYMNHHLCIIWNNADKELSIWIAETEINYLF